MCFKSRCYLHWDVDQTNYRTVHWIIQLSFEQEDLLCVQVDMHWRAFRQLSQQNRFGGDGSEQLQGAIGHIMTSCTEPFPDPFKYHPANIQIGGLSISDVGIRKKGFVGSVLKPAEERPSLKIKADKYIEGQLVDGFEKVTLNNNDDLHGYIPA